MHRLYKDKENRMLGGVCAGLADYTGTDITLIRAAAVILCLSFTPLISVYFLLLLILPDKSEVRRHQFSGLSDLKEALKSGKSSAYVKTGILLIVGAIVLMVLTETFFHVDIKLKYIIIFSSIIFGLYLITTKDLHSNPSGRVITGAGVCMLTLLWLASSTGILYLPIAITISTLAKIWPILPAAFGVSLLLQNKRHISILWIAISSAIVLIAIVNYISVLI